jgi:hypothetical protein
MWMKLIEDAKQQWKVEDAIKRLERWFLVYGKANISVKAVKVFQNTLAEKNQFQPLPEGLGYFYCCVQLRIIRKRQAANRIKAQLLNASETNDFARVVHQFLYAVKRSQSLMHDFVRCKQERVSTLKSKLWDAQELDYIKGRLRRARKSAGKGGDSNLTKASLLMPEKDRIEMDKLDRSWEIVHKNMARGLVRYREGGILSDNVTDHTHALALRVPSVEVTILLRSHLEAIRREFRVDGEIQTARKAQELLSFNTADARSLLHLPDKEVLIFICARSHLFDLLYGFVNASILTLSHSLFVA